MGWFALALAVAGALCVALPNPGMFIAMGLGMFATTAGFIGYRRRRDPGTARLAGAGAMAVGIWALILSGTKYGLTLVALSRLEQLF